MQLLALVKLYVHHLRFSGVFQLNLGHPVSPQFSSSSCSREEPMGIRHGFLWPGCPSCHPAKSANVSACSETQCTGLNQGKKSSAASSLLYSPPNFWGNGCWLLYTSSPIRQNFVVLRHLLVFDVGTKSEFLANFLIIRKLWWLGQNHRWWNWCSSHHRL